MSEAGTNPAEAILRLCADAAPQPWYPRIYAKQTGVDLDALAFCLEELWMDGLLEKTAGTTETGPGISLTPAGERVLQDPLALQRLRTGQPLNPADRGTIIRQVFRGPLRPYVTRLIVLLNVLVFVGGYYAARQHRIDNDFLRGPPLTAGGEVANLLERSGSLSARGLLDGQWWRLLTAGFVHIGFMHLLLNMIFLYMAGRYIEQMWGHIRYAIIYLTGLLGGCCLSVSHFVGLSAGASGAVCGLLGAEAVWFLLNRRYLPRSLLRQARFSLISSAILLVFISSFKDVSGWGHLGGAVAGALAALLLHLHRFGPAGWRWLAVAGFVPLAWLGYYAIDRARAVNPKWHEIEDQHFVDRYYLPVRNAMSKASTVYQEAVLPLLQVHPTRRNDAQLKSVLSVAAQQQHELNALAERLDHVGSYRSPEAEDARQTSREYILARADLFARAEHLLSLGDKRTWKDTQALGQQEQRVIKLHDKWRSLFTR